MLAAAALEYAALGRLAPGFGIKCAKPTFGPQCKRMGLRNGKQGKWKSDSDGDLLTDGNDIELVSPSCALINKKCHVKNKDICKFLDGIYLKKRSWSLEVINKVIPVKGAREEHPYHKFYYHKELQRFIYIGRLQKAFMFNAKVALAALKLMMFFALPPVSLHRLKQRSFTFVLAIGMPVSELQRFQNLWAVGHRMNKWFMSSFEDRQDIHQFGLRHMLGFLFWMLSIIRESIESRNLVGERNIVLPFALPKGKGGAILANSQAFQLLRGGTNSPIDQVCLSLSLHSHTIM
uniref:Uncharacterized protein n=1 Tax=Cucumis melo TaxID=3656 RepID=A0A9I9EBJ3_CUCME